MFRRTLGRALSLATVASLLMTTVVFADDIVAEAQDSVTNGNATNVFLSSDNGLTQSFEVALAIECADRTHIAGNTTISMSSASSIPAGGSLSAESVTIVKPAGWPADTSRCGSTSMTAYGSSTVTVTAPAAVELDKEYTFQLRWSSSDPDATSGDADVSIKFTVTGTGSGGGGTDPDPCEGAAVATPAISSDPAGPNGLNNWYTSVPTVSATTATTGATVQYSTNGTTWTSTAPTLANGTTTVSAKATHDTCSGVESAVATREFKVDTTAPLITFEGQTPDGWTNGSVVLEWSCSDATSSVVAPTITKTISAEGQNQQESATCTNGAGLTASSTDGDADIDLTAPTITASVAPYVPGNWTNQDVLVDFTCADNVGGSGIPAGNNTVADVTVDTSAADQSVTSTGTCTDAAGNPAAHVTVSNIDIDKVKPLISGSVTPIDGNNGWHKTAPTVSFTCSDALSGLASCLVNGTSSSSIVLGESASAQTINGTATDSAGNTETASVSNLYVDLSAPLLNVTDPNTSTSFSICAGAAPSRPSFAPSDLISGIDNGTSVTYDSWTTPTTASGVGTYTYTANAQDLAGHTASSSQNYSVSYGTTANGGAFSGVLQPVNADGTSRFKTGSTVPIKFRLMCGTTSISNAVAALTVRRLDGTPDAGEQEVVSTAASTTGNLFRYSADGAQYIFNLNTKAPYTYGTTSTSFSAGTYQFTITLDSGEKYSFNFQLVK